MSACMLSVFAQSLALYLWTQPKISKQFGQNTLTFTIPTQHTAAVWMPQGPVTFGIARQS